MAIFPVNKQANFLNMHLFKVALSTLLAACMLLNTAHLHAQTYSVKKISPGAITINGKGDAEAWGKANVLTAFTYPWDSVAAPATSFAALWDGTWLYCLYHVKDDSIFIRKMGNERMDVGGSDRVELFLKSNDSMTPYYCLELDAAARSLDYAASWYRKMNYAWRWPDEQLIVKSSRTKDGYIVEFGISIQSLKNLGLIQDNRLQAGLFRAECVGLINNRSDLRWISWVNPHSTKPDFHIPQAFGILTLEE